MAAAPRDAAPLDHYAVLGVARGSSAAAIKAAYRALVKRHHPDAGGDSRRMLALNAAWEVLGDGERRRRYDAGLGAGPLESSSSGPSRGPQPRRRADTSGERPGAAASEDLRHWLRAVYAPLDRLLGQVIGPFPAALRALAADPYDDALMEAFCAFLTQSRARLVRAETLYRSRACPDCARGFGLSLYHCLAQLQDAVSELDRYTLGYVDSYLRDGREMVREVRQRRQRLHEERRRLEI